MFLGMFLLLLQFYLIWRFSPFLSARREALKHYQLLEACSYLDFLALGYGLYGWVSRFTGQFNFFAIYVQLLGQTKGQLMQEYISASYLFLLYETVQAWAFCRFLHPSLGLLALLVGGGLILLSYSKRKQDLLKRQEAIIIALPFVVGKLMLLLNAGQTLKRAWKNVAWSQEGVLYAQMRQVSEDEGNGVSEKEAILLFARRCGDVQVRKFAALILQSYSKGSLELLGSLEGMLEMAWQAKKNLVLQRAKGASQQLLLPAALIFFGILLIIMGPLLSGEFY